MTKSYLEQNLIKGYAKIGELINFKYMSNISNTTHMQNNNKQIQNSQGPIEITKM